MIEEKFLKLLKEMGYNESASPEERKAFIRQEAKKIHPDVDDLTEEEKIEAYDKIQALDAALMELKRENRIKNYGEDADNYYSEDEDLDEEDHEMVDFYEMFSRFMNRMMGRHYSTYEELQQPTDLDELDYFDFQSLIQEDEIRFQRSDGSIFSLGNAQFSDFTFYIYELSSDGLDGVAHLYTNMSPDYIYDIVTDPAKKEFFTDVFFNPDRLEKLEIEDFPKSCEGDAAVCNYYIGEIVNGEAPLTKDNIFVDPITASMILFDQIIRTLDEKYYYTEDKKEEARMKLYKDFITFFKMVKNDEKVSFDIAFSLKAGKKYQLTNGATVYSYLYKKEEDDEPKTIYLDMSPEEICKTVSEKKGYLFFTETFLAEDRVSRVLADNPDAVMLEGSEACEGYGYAGHMIWENDRPDYGFHIYGESDTMQAIREIEQNETQAENTEDGSVYGSAESSYRED